jgi:hypothetical protein
MPCFSDGSDFTSPVGRNQKVISGFQPERLISQIYVGRLPYPIDKEAFSLTEEMK